MQAELTRIRRVVDLAGASFRKGRTIFNNLEQGEVIGHDGVYLKVASLTRPGHTIMLRAFYLCDAEVNGSEVEIDFAYETREREDFNPAWTAARVPVGSEIVFAVDQGFKPFVLAEDFDIQLGWAKMTVLYRAVRGSEVLAQDEDLEKLLADVEKASRPKPGMEALAGLLPKVQYQQKKFAGDWQNVNIVYE